METTNKNTQKLTYSPPQIERIKLDNDISLQLESEAPPLGPGESIGALKYNNNDPFKQQQV
ncbi:MAG: hypothetical protein PHS59_00195 [Paludibacter sp.]|nr:hypothetical protein [Paludibacter sp.]